MQTGFPAAFLVAAISLLCACRGEAAVSDAPSSTAAPAAHVSIDRTNAPSLVWERASRVGILCQLDTSAADKPSMEEALCERVLSVAAAGAPLPVSVAEAPDGTATGEGAVLLLVHASVGQVGGQSLLTLTVRPYRQSAGDGAVLFGTAPRAVPFDGAGMTGPTIEAALRSSLGEILPWIGGGNAPRPI